MSKIVFRSARYDRYKKVELYASGVAVCWDYEGHGHTPHPSVWAKLGRKAALGREAAGDWEKADRLIRAGSWFFNVSRWECVDEYQETAARYCQCGHPLCGVAEDLAAG